MGSEKTTGKTDDFEIKTLHRSRLGIRDMLHEGHRKHMIHGLIEGSYRQISPSQDKF